jgi:hypothetical protein
MTLEDTEAPDLSGVTDMNGTFAYASKFDSDMKGWNISTIKNMSEMLNDTNLSVENYSNTLNGWLDSAVLEQNITLDANTRKYNALGKSAKGDLNNSDSYNWTINDAGLQE